MIGDMQNNMWMEFLRENNYPNSALRRFDRSVGEGQGPTVRELPKRQLIQPVMHGTLAQQPSAETTALCVSRFLKSEAGKMNSWEKIFRFAFLCL